MIKKKTFYEKNLFSERIRGKATNVSFLIWLSHLLECNVFKTKWLIYILSYREFHEKGTQSYLCPQG